MATEVVIFDSDRARYTAERYAHGTVLTYYPRSVARGHIRVGTRQTLVTLANTGSAVLDAFQVAKLHAASLGHPQPEIVA